MRKLANLTLWIILFCCDAVQAEQPQPVYMKDNGFIAEALLNSLKPHLALAQLELFVPLHKLINDLHYDEARKILRQLAELP